MRSIVLDKPVRIRHAKGQKRIRAGTEVFIDGRRNNYYSAYPVMVSEDIAVKYMGYEPEGEPDEPDEEVNGS